MQTFSEDLKYPSGSLVYGGHVEDDYLYFLPDNRELDVCWVMMRNIGYRSLRRVICNAEGELEAFDEVLSTHGNYCASRMLEGLLQYLKMLHANM